jgi:hypothetical protein
VPPQLRQQFQSLIWDFIGEGHDMKTELESCVAAKQQPQLRKFREKSTINYLKIPNK